MADDYKEILALLEQGYHIIESDTAHGTFYIIAAPLQDDKGLPVEKKVFQALKKDRKLGFCGHTDSGDIRHGLKLMGKSLRELRSEKKYGKQ